MTTVLRRRIPCECKLPDLSAFAAGDYLEYDCPDCLARYRTTTRFPYTRIEHYGFLGLRSREISTAPFIEWWPHPEYPDGRREQWEFVEAPSP